MANETNEGRLGSGAKERTAEIPLQAFARESKEKRPAAVTILKPLEEVYVFMRDFANFPKFMQGVKQVTAVSPTVSHWVSDEDGGGRPTEWDSEIVAETPDRMIAWQTIGESALKQTGVVMFERAAGGRGTVVSMKINYENLMGQFIGAFQKLAFKDPNSHAEINLRRLKAFLETGEVPTVKGQPNGRDEQDKH